MSFEPKNITKKHILQAVEKIIQEKPKLSPSTRWLVEIDKIVYPPKEVMRYAHQEMNGEFLWNYGGGDLTNKWLEKYDFKIIDKSIKVEPNINVILVNITWNSNNWILASDDTSNHEWAKNPDNIPHESWNFDFENARNSQELIYGYCKFTNPPKNAGDNFLVIFTSQKKVIGFYGKAEVLKKEKEVNDLESYNLIGHKEYSLVLENKLDLTPEYLEGKKRIGQIGFNKLNKKQTALSILGEALELNQDQSKKIEKIINWVQDGKIYSDSNTKNNPDEMEEKIALNQILYGPPGTGKTYHTINEALKITAPIFYKEFKNDRSELLKRFRELRNEGQIAFTTFHQSMSYEEFVEGIKPQSPQGDNGNISYKIEDGIFKRIAITARENMELSVLKNDTSTSAKIPFESAFEMLKEKIASALLSDVIDTPNKMKKGLVIDLSTSFFSLTGINGDSIRMMTRTGNEQNTMTRSTLKKIYEYPEFAEEVIKGGMITYYKALVDEINSWKVDFKDKIEKIEAKNFVLIIDEINRGNVSQIFGELITLLEEDKRIGNKEALEAILPYSKPLTFGVPANLFIVGTMNTADRSVEALDAALRRRFSFVQMNPQTDLEELDYEIDGIHYQEVLNTINERITYLKDEDHQIGHSYFIGIEDNDDLRNVFKKNIIPLLKEYFYNDTNKIRHILGEGFVTKLEAPKFAVKDADEDFFERYRIVEIDDDFDIIGALTQTVS